MAVIYVGNRPFPITPNPQSGDHYLGLDSGNSNRLTRQDSLGVVRDLESGLSYTDADAVLAIQDEIRNAVQANDVGVDDEVYIRDVTLDAFRRVPAYGLRKLDIDRFWNVASDFFSTVNGDFTSYTNGTGASNATGTYGEDLIERAIGVTRSQTGTTTSGRAALGIVSVGAVRPLNADFRFAGRYALEALSDLTNTFTQRIGFGTFYNTAGDGTSGLFFRYTDLQNGGRYECVSRIAGVDVLAIDSGFAPDLDYHIFEVTLNENANLVEFRIDGNVVGVINNPALIPQGANNMGAGYKIEKNAGTTTRAMNVDWMLVEYYRSANR
jgi:hypothetical protein